ncbi:MAG: hypothetical protein AAB642_02835, partial [Patescibacteria group bacterium]
VEVFPQFKIWKTPTIGGVPRDELLKLLQNEGHDVSDWARDIMSQPAFTTSSEASEITLIRIKVKNLGFTYYPTTIQLFARIKEVGDLCPAEVGPYLCALNDQPKGDWFWIAMEPITGPDGDPRVFSVRRRDDGKLWLSAVYTSPGSQWGLECEIVFRLRK